MSDQRRTPRILWVQAATVLGAAVLIGAEVFGLAFAGGWALALLLGWGEIASRLLQGLFGAMGVAVMWAFMKRALLVEPCVSRDQDRP